MNTIYSNYHTSERIPPELVPTMESSYLPHSYYVNMVISELCVMDQPMYELPINEMMDRLNHLISFIHEDREVKRTTSIFFNDEENLREVLLTIQDAGLLRVNMDSISLSNSQLDYLRDYLLDYHHLD